MNLLTNTIMGAVGGFIVVAIYLVGYFMGMRDHEKIDEKYRVETLSDEEFCSYREGKEISPDLAMRVLQGDPEAIAELNESN